MISHSRSIHVRTSVIGRLTVKRCRPSWVRSLANGTPIRSSPQLQLGGCVGLVVLDDGIAKDESVSF